MKEESSSALLQKKQFKKHPNPTDHYLEGLGAITETVLREKKDGDFRMIIDREDTRENDAEDCPVYFGAGPEEESYDYDNPRHFQQEQDYKDDRGRRKSILTGGITEDPREDDSSNMTGRRDTHLHSKDHLVRRFESKTGSGEELDGIENFKNMYKLEGRVMSGEIKSLVNNYYDEIIENIQPVGSHKQVINIIGNGDIVIGEQQSEAYLNVPGAKSQGLGKDRKSLPVSSKKVSERFFSSKEDIGEGPLEEIGNYSSGYIQIFVEEYYKDIVENLKLGSAEILNRELNGEDGPLRDPTIVREDSPFRGAMKKIMKPGSLSLSGRGTSEFDLINNELLQKVDGWYDGALESAPTESIFNIFEILQYDHASSKKTQPTGHFKSGTGLISDVQTALCLSLKNLIDKDARPRAPSQISEGPQEANSEVGGIVKSYLEDFIEIAHKTPLESSPVTVSVKPGQP
jgi:hypothetical protein